MNIDNFKLQLQFLSEQKHEISACVYAVLKDNTDNPVKLDIEGKSLDELKEIFIQDIHDKILNQDDLVLLNLSSADTRPNAIYIYDFNLPDELKSLEKIAVCDNLPLLDLENQNLASIKALLIEIGNNENQIILYKSMAQINIYSRKSFFLKKSKHRLEKINEEFLRIVPSFELLRMNETFFIKDLKFFEKAFRFHEIIKEHAKQGINAIEEKAIIENPQGLYELIDDIRLARKLTQIAKHSPVLNKNIPNTSIIEFCQSFPRLQGKLRFNNDLNKIVLDTNKSKELFLNLLMDNFLTSELTKLHYESIAKDGIDDN